MTPTQVIKFILAHRQHILHICVCNWCMNVIRNVRSHWRDHKTFINWFIIYPAIFSVALYINVWLTPLMTSVPIPWWHPNVCITNRKNECARCVVYVQGQIWSLGLDRLWSHCNFEMSYNNATIMMITHSCAFITLKHTSFINLMFNFWLIHI